MGFREALRTILRVLRLLMLRLWHPAILNYHGVIVPFRATRNLGRVRKMIYSGHYERTELAGMGALLRPDDVVLEIGAGCGIVSAFIAKRLATPNNLHSFEANPGLVPSIEAVCRANNLPVRVQQKAVSSEDGQISMFIDEWFLSSSLVDRQRGAKEVIVPAVSLKRLLSELSPTVLMVDVEGAETFFLGLDIPPSVRAACLELHPHIIGDAKTSSIVRHFLDQGFSLLIDKSQDRVVTLERNPAD